MNYQCFSIAFPPRVSPRRLLMVFLSAALLVVAMPEPSAYASGISGSLIAFNAAGAFAYNSSGFIGGMGAGILTTAVGSLPAGTQVDWNINGYLIGAYLATISGSTITQTFVFPPGYSGMSITLASDGSNVLSGDCWAS